MAHLEPKPLDPASDAEPKQGATGRRWGVSLALICVGVGTLVFGLVDHYWPALAAGAVLIMLFGAIGAGARKAGAGAGEVLHAEVDFNAPPPPPGKRKTYLPPGAQSRRKRR